MEKKNFFHTTVFLLTTLCLFSICFAEELNTFHFQGRLVNSEGSPISATVNMTFRLYDRNNNNLWSETLPVNVIAGEYNLVLGKSTPIALTVNEQVKYFGLSVEGDSEMEPRQEIAGVLRAGMALSITDSAISTSKLADNAVTANKIANNAISSDKIADNAIITNKIASNAVSSDKIADNSIAPAKLAGPSSALTNGTNGQTLISNGDGTFHWGNPLSGVISADSGIKLGTFSTCNASYEGLIRYNSTSKTIEFCNGSDWTEISGSSDSGICGPDLVLDDQQTVTGWTACYLPGTASSTLRATACSSLFDSAGKNYGCWHSNSTYPHENSSAMSSACAASVQNTTTYDAWSGTAHILIVCIQN